MKESGNGRHWLPTGGHKMASRTAGYLKRMYEDPKHALTRHREAKAAPWSPATKGLAILGVAAAAAVVVAGVYYMPDFMRYVKIRRM